MKCPCCKNEIDEEKLVLAQQVIKSIEKGDEGMKQEKDWYEKTIEEPIRPLVKLLRNNGFNTFCSCGHPPSPYIQMEMYEDSDMTRLYNLMMENGYTHFTIIAQWDRSTGCPNKHLEVRLYIPQQSNKIKAMKEGKE